MNENVDELLGRNLVLWFSRVESDLKILRQAIEEKNASLMMHCMADLEDLIHGEMNWTIHEVLASYSDPTEGGTISADELYDATIDEWVTRMNNNGFDIDVEDYKSSDE